LQVASYRIGSIRPGTMRGRLEVEDRPLQVLR
jgi:hypothetical protein